MTPQTSPKGIVSSISALHLGSGSLPYYRVRGGEELFTGSLLVNVLAWVIRVVCMYPSIGLCVRRQIYASKPADEIGTGVS